MSVVNMMSSHELILSGEESLDMKHISGTLGTECVAKVTSAKPAIKLDSG